MLILKGNNRASNSSWTIKGKRIKIKEKVKIKDKTSKKKLKKINREAIGTITTNKVKKSTSRTKTLNNMKGMRRT